MIIKKMEKNEVFGLLRSDIDVHTLGVSTVGKSLEECGYKVIIADATVTKAVANISSENNIDTLHKWIVDNKITRLGFSYRLDPKDAKKSFDTIYALLDEKKELSSKGGQLEQLYFSGLPEACEYINEKYQDIPTFMGDETPLETLKKLGVPEEEIPKNISEGSKYDEDRLAFARTLIATGSYKTVKPSDRPTYENYGTSRDTIMERIASNRKKGNPPLMRAHVGPYNPNYKQAIEDFKGWLHALSSAKFLDIVSIGSSQLSQSDFGKDWGDKPNGGGVPINSEKDLQMIWEAARPMLVRTYAGTRNIPELAAIYEKNINIAWHVLSFWWFNQIDGRGPYPVKKNLEQHIETLKVAAKSNKPFEPNIPHHFGFRGGDDYTYVLSAYLAAKTAKKNGVQYFILQTMLNTPKHTWGVQDLAKSRALLKLVRELEDESFTVYHQPRAGLDYLSTDLETAKVQLAAVSMMMDDIEPDNEFGPDIIHVVSYCEAVTLATPQYINESIQIVIDAIREYREQKENGAMPDMKHDADVIERTEDLYKEVSQITKLIEENIDDPYSPEGLYEVFKLGIFVTPYLWEGRAEFSEAIKWNTSLVSGSVKVVDSNGEPINPTQRVREIFDKKSSHAN